MRTSLPMRAAAASAAALLFLSPGLKAAFAHSQTSFRAPVPRPGFVHSHGFGPGRQSWSWRNENGRNRFSRYGWFWNQGGFYGPGFWYWPYGFGETAGAVGGAGGLVIAVGAPSLAAFPAAIAESADPSPKGGCVIHKLIYDGSGKYVGERQTPEC
jgi:hypothetical protein